MPTMKIAFIIVFFQYALHTSYGLDVATRFTQQNLCLSSVEARLAVENLVDHVQESTELSVLKSSSDHQAACLKAFSKSLIESFGEAPCHPLNALERRVSEGLQYCKVDRGLQQVDHSTIARDVLISSPSAKNSVSGNKDTESALLPLAMQSKQLTYRCGPRHWCCVFSGTSGYSCFGFWCPKCRFYRRLCSKKHRKLHKHRKSGRSKKCWWFKYVWWIRGQCSNRPAVA